MPRFSAVVLTVLLLWLARNVAEVLLFLFLAVLIAVYLDALTDFIVRKTSLGRRGALAVAVLGTILIAVGLGALLVPPVIEQTRQLVTKLPDYAVAWKARVALLVERFPALKPLVTTDTQAQFVSGALEQAQGFVEKLIPKVFNVVRGFIDVASILVMGLYLALHPRVYLDFIVSITPPARRDATRDVLATLGKTLRSWVMAQLLTMAVLGALMAIGFKVLNVPYWLTFGLFGGLAAIVPFFGALIFTVVPALFVLGGPAGPVGAVLVLLWGVAVHVIEANVVAPLIMSRGVHLPPVFSIMAVLIAGTLLGPLGLLIAVPSLCVVMVLVRKILIERIYGDVATNEERREDAELALAPSNTMPREQTGA